LSLVEILQSRTFDRADAHEDILTAIIGFDKSENPDNRILPWRTISTEPCRAALEIIKSRTLETSFKGVIPIVVAGDRGGG
jgi:hypothetical protein